MQILRLCTRQKVQRCEGRRRHKIGPTGRYRAFSQVPATMASSHTSKGSAVLPLMHGNEGFSGRLCVRGTKGTCHANVPPGASDLDHAKLPLRWLAPLDVAAPEGRALPSSMGVQPCA